MCGRYALGIRAAFVRHRMQQENMQVDDWADDDEARETYNFAPGYNGLVYRANVPDAGARAQEQEAEEWPVEANAEARDPDEGDAALDAEDHDDAIATNKDDTYRLQAMKWGLIPFWTKRNPDYGSMMKTINCRDDSLLENRGMWTSMKKSKRCVVVAQGFFEWLKRNGGKEKIPHFVKRKDDKLMCFAGLWDCVQFEGSDDKVYTYTIITTDSNKQLNFLHDRMPVILENGSSEMWNWLDPKRTKWNKELQSLLIPFKGELECYPVVKDVGKVGNNSHDFVVPAASTENKNNIANFFANTKKPGQSSGSALDTKKDATKNPEIKIESNKDERITTDPPRSEDNAPIPKPDSSPERGVKRSLDEKDEGIASPETKTNPTANSSPSRTASPIKKKLRSSTSNGTAPNVKSGAGNQRITSFFSK